MVYRYGQLGDFTSDLNAALATRLPKQPLPTITNTKKRKTPGSTVKALLQPAPKTTPTIATVPDSIASDYLPAGSRVEVWLSLTSLPWWAGPGLGVIPTAPTLLIGTALTLYRKTQAEKYASQAREILSAQPEFTDVAVALSQGNGALSINVTTTLDFSREAHAAGRVVELLQNAGLQPVMTISKVLRRGASGQRVTGIRGAIDPDNPNKGVDPTKKSALDLFFESLGLSAPFAVVAGGLLLILIVRR